MGVDIVWYAVSSPTCVANTNAAIRVFVGSNFFFQIIDFTFDFANINTFSIVECNSRTVVAPIF